MKKLTRDEMKNVVGGLIDPGGSCDTPGACEAKSTDTKTCSCNSNCKCMCVTIIVGDPY
jgi:hypothetical protein